MRKSFVAAFALVAVLAAATPVSAGPRDRNTEPPLTRIIKKFAKKVFGITTTADPTVPIPDPTKP